MPTLALARFSLPRSFLFRRRSFSFLSLDRFLLLRLGDRDRERLRWRRLPFRRRRSFSARRRAGSMGGPEVSGSSAAVHACAKSRPVGWLPKCGGGSPKGNATLDSPHSPLSLSLSLPLLPLVEVPLSLSLPCARSRCSRSRSSSCRLRSCGRRAGATPMSARHVYLARPVLCR